MPLAGVSENDQKNIVRNNLTNSINNTSTNIQNTTAINTQTCNANLTVNIGSTDCNDERDCRQGHSCPDIINTASCDQSLHTTTQLFSQTDTNFDTTLTNNISNELKNKAKIETPSFMGGGLFSSQANHQLNESVNTQKNTIRNNITTKRQNMFSNSESASTNLTVNIGDIKGCTPVTNTSGAVQESIVTNIISTIDQASVSNYVDNTITNVMSNAVEMIGTFSVGGAISSIIFIIVLKMCFGGKSTASSAVTSGIVLCLTGGLFYVMWEIYVNPESTEVEANCITGYEIDETKTDEIEKCKEKTNQFKNWEELRADTNNFSSWKVENSVTVETNGDKTSVRGIVYDESSGSMVDYTSLNHDPFDGTDCTIDNPDTNKCRTIKEDYEWEQILKGACGCCGCDPNRIDYYPDTATCKLDNSRGYNDPCDKSIEIIQPGVGYKTSGPAVDGIYNTTCRKYDGTKCNKKTGDGGLTELNDDDPDNIKVIVSSRDRCVGKNDNASKCYQAENASDAGSNTIFGNPTETRCVETGAADGAAGVADLVAGLVDICPFSSADNPNGCVKADKCTVDFKTAVSLAATAAARDGTHVTDSKSACDSTGWSPDDKGGITQPQCEYKIDGVSEILINDKPANHIDSPDHIYTIDKSSVVQYPDMNMYFYLGSENPTTLQNVENESDRSGGKWVTDSGAPNIYQVSSRLESSNATKGSEFHNLGQDCTTGGAGHEIISEAKFENFGIHDPDGTNLCDARFRRIPACAKDADGTPSDTFGCGNSQGGEDCLLCKNNNSEEMIEPTYDESIIWDFTWGAITEPRGGGALVFYIIAYLIIIVTAGVLQKYVF